MALSDTVARMIELPMGGARATENARRAVQKPRAKKQEIELTLAQHRNIDAIALSLGRQAMFNDADPDVVGMIFDLLAEERIEPDAARGLLGELGRQPTAGDDILRALELERIDRSKSNHPAGADIRQVTVSSV